MSLYESKIMAFLFLVVGGLVLVAAVIYLLRPKSMPTVDIRKFPRKFPDEKVTFLHHFPSIVFFVLLLCDVYFHPGC